MIDIGIWELGVLALVVLMLVGPKRLPGIVRRCGYWLGRARKWRDSIRAQGEEILNEKSDEDASDSKKDQQKKS